MKDLNIGSIKMKKILYYEEDEGEFYWVKETPKTFIIDWVEKVNCDSQKTSLDQNVRWKNLKVSKEKNRKHCLKDVGENFNGKTLLIYPFQAGQPFYLEQATKEHIDKEIKSCIKWGISSQYYQDLLPFTN